MALNREDSTKINYKPDVDWYTERMYAISSGSEDQSKKYRPSEEKVDPKVLLNRFRDLKKKATKLDDAIDTLSAALRIPVDTVKQPKVSFAVKTLDSASNGEYVSYELYKRLLSKTEDGTRALSLDWIIENTTSDIYANSDLIYYRYGMGAQINEENISNFSVAAEEIKGEVESEILTGIKGWANQEFFIKQVLDFSNKFLAKTTDAEYIPWKLKPDIRRKLIEYPDIDMFLSQYTDLAVGLSEAVSLMPNRPLELARDFYDALSGKSENDNNFFNKINDVLGFNYTADLVCCFASWSHGLDVKTLKALRMILSMVGNGVGFDFGKLMNALINIINNLFRNVIGSQILALVDKIFQLITNPIRNWLNTDDEKWRRIFLCTPIDELINTYILGGIAYLENKLIEKLMDYLKLLEIDVHFEDCKITLLEKTKKLDALTRILDMVIDIIERLSYCGVNDSPLRDRVSTTLQNVEISPNWNYAYPEEESPNKYNSFTKNITTVEEIINPDTGANEVVERTEPTFVKSISTERLSVSEDQIDLCLKRIAEEDVFSVQQWMEDLRSNSTEEMNV